MTQLILMILSIAAIAFCVTSLPQNPRFIWLALFPFLFAGIAAICFTRLLVEILSQPSSRAQYAPHSAKVYGLEAGSEQVGESASSIGRTWERSARTSLNPSRAASARTVQAFSCWL